MTGGVPQLNGLSLTFDKSLEFLVCSTHATQTVFDRGACSFHNL